VRAMITASIGGLVLGLLIPYGSPVAPPEVRTVRDQPPRVERRCPTAPVEPKEASHGVDEAIVQFEAAWGVPSSAPSGFDPAAAEASIAARLGPLAPDRVRIDCSLYPCVGLVAIHGDFDELPDVADLLGVAPELVSDGFVISGDERVDYRSFAVVAEGEDVDPRWARALRRRHAALEEKGLVHLVTGEEVTLRP
jgi:hypothetical protein